jgi:sucrose 6(F)-phosphate phosphorylase
VQEVDEAVQTPIVQRLLRLIRFRNEFPAFNGKFRVLDSTDSEIVLAWQQADKMCRLTVDLDTYQAVIAYADGTGEMAEYRV